MSSNESRRRLRDSFMNMSIRTHVLVVIAIVLFGTALYASMLGNDFIYNDYEMVADNSFITSRDNLKSFFGEEYFTGSREGSYRPFVTLTFMADYALWGRNPFGFHLTNLILHLLNGILLYFMLTLMLPSLGARAPAEDKSLAGWVTMPLAAALLFISHPVGTEGVISIGSRHELVTGVFYIASVYFYFLSKSGPRLRAFGCYVLSLGTYFLAMMSKEMGVMVPAFILLADLFPAKAGRKEEGLGRKFLSNLPAYAGYVLVALCYFYIRFIKVIHPVGAHNSYFSASNLFGGDYFTHFMTVMIIMKDYLLILLFPLRLSLEYVVPPVPSPLCVPAVLSLLAIASVAVFAVCQRRRRALIFLGWAWFFIAILPMSNLVIPLLSTRMSERFLYLPMAGYCIFLAAAIWWATGADKEGTVRAAKKLFTAVIAVILCLYSVRTVMRVRDWHDSLTFWESAAKTGQESYRTHNNLAMQYYYEGRKDKAVEELKLALKLGENPQTRVNLGFVYLEQGELDKAEAEFKMAISDEANYASAYYHLAIIAIKRGQDDRAIDLLLEAVARYPRLRSRPFEHETHNALGLVLAKKGMKDQAIEEYKKAIEIRPDFKDARLDLAKLYMDSGVYDKAAEEFKNVLAADPGNVDVAVSLGYAYVKKGLDEKAAEAFVEALKAKPDNFQLRYILAGTYLRMKALDKAEAEYLEVLRIDPSSADSRNNLANIYYTRGLADKAIEEYEKALKIDPSYFKARNNLANVYLLTGRFDRAVEEYKKVLQVQPGNAVVRYNLGLAYEGKEMFDEAVREWEEALRIDPTFVQAGEALRRLRGQ